MKNNPLKIISVIAIISAIVVSLMLIFSSLQPKKEGIIEEIIDITPNPTEIPQISPNNTPKIDNRDDELVKEIEKKIDEIRLTLNNVSDELPKQEIVQMPTPQIIIQMPQAQPSQTPVPSPAPVETIMPTQTTMPSQKSLEIINHQAGQGLILRPSQKFVATGGDLIDSETERSYLNIGLIVRGDDGKSVKDEIVSITTTDSEQNKELNGSGDITKIVNEDGIKEMVYYYPFHYEFRTTGDHAITFQADGITEVVNIKGVVEPSNN